jgi:bisphosphoglycerate-independent phosphoglycerate mutase (AlkP superfamily)
MAKEEGQNVIMVRPFTKPDDVHGMLASKGILTSEGGATSHAAVVARQFGVPCVVGAASIRIDLDKREMSANDIKDKIIPELEKRSADFICLNFANPDMVGHTGVFEAAVKACETVDKCNEAVTETARKNGYAIIIIADHGNADMMVNEDGSPNTAHTTNLVPCILVDDDYKGKLKDGKLGDLAPTILTLMGVPIPKEMTGNILIDK